MGNTLHSVTLIPGDWIGPETCDVARAVIAALGIEIDWDVQPCPDGVVTPALLESAHRTGVVLAAKTESQRESGRLPAIVTLRQELGTYATVRAVKSLPGSAAVYRDTDLVVIRETSEDIYSGMEHEITAGVYEAVKVTTEAACERIARFAYDYARKNGRKTVDIVHKSNIMKKSDGLFLRTAQRVAAEYPDIETREVIVDALCMRLVRNPHQFDVLLCGNLFGDIVSDLAAGLAGGILTGASSSYGEQAALFANPHGNAPDLVGTDGANPIPMLRVSTHLLAHLGEADAAARLEAAVEQVVAAGVHTQDMGGSARCSEVKAAILAAL